jgi:hypothetical protein
MLAYVSCWQHVASRVFFFYPHFVIVKFTLKNKLKNFLKFPNFLVKNLPKKTYLKEKHYKFVNIQYIFIIIIIIILISISVLNMSNPNARSTLRGWQKKNIS